jgi:DNA-binding NarL/FixJ family response regulator
LRLGRNAWPLPKITNHDGPNSLLVYQPCCPKYSDDGQSFIIVNDEHESLQVTRFILKNAKAKMVHSCKSSKSALDILDDQDHKIDCVISKYVMEEMSGLELLQRIREGRNYGRVRDTRFVLVTPYSDIEVVRAAVALDVDGYGVKPISQNRMIQILIQAFSRKRILQTGSHYGAIELPKKP